MHHMYTGWNMCTETFQTIHEYVYIGGVSLSYRYVNTEFHFIMYLYKAKELMNQQTWSQFCTYLERQ
jgi:hypothetical protein